MKSLLVVVVLSCMTLLYGQWSWVTPAIQGNDLYAVYFINNNIGWAGGAGNTLLKTTNGGYHWKPLHTGIQNMTVGQIHFTDINTGYILSKQPFSNQLYKTTDGGHTFSNITPSGVTGIYSFSFPDKLNGYLCTIFRTYKTTDAGATWSASLSDSLEGVTEIRFTSNGFGFGFSYGLNFITFTTNMGNTWQKKVMHGINQITNAAFISPEYGFITAADSGVYRTTNGGASVERVYTIYANGTTAIELLNDRSIVIAAANNVYKSQDGGNNWWVVYFSAPQIHSISFYDEQGGFMVGKYGVIMKTTDAGFRWNGSLPSFYGTVTSFEPAEADIIYAATSKAEVLTINKNDYSLTLKYRFPFSSITAMDFVDSQYGFAAVDSAIYKTTDGSASWNKSYAPGGAPIYCLGFFNRNVGIASGEVQSLFRTTDGGVTWSNIEPPAYPVTGISRTLQIIDSAAAVITAGNGLVLKTTDMGLTWQRIEADNGSILPAVHFIDRNSGFIGGSYETLYKTTDGGATWVKIPTPSISTGFPGVWYSSIKFWDNLHGIITATNGSCLTTQDGGNSWSVNPSPSGYTGDAVTLNNGLALVAGGSGSILAFADPMQQPAPLTGDTYQLKQNYPNPFNPKTEIPVNLLEDAYISVKIYNIAGEMVKELFTGWLGAGPYNFTFNASNLPTGIYFARLQSGINFRTIKMMMVK